MDNRQKKLVFIGCLLLGAVGTSFFAHNFSRPQVQVTKPVAKQEFVKKKTKVKKQIKVYVSGAVDKPGLYDLPAGTRALAAVEAAGGFSADANVEKVNLARILRDGAQVNVPRVKAAKAKTSKQKTTLKKSTPRKQKKSS